MIKKIRIGTRASELALTQSHIVASKIRANFSDIEVELIEIKTSGEWNPKDGEKPLSEVDGGKALFAKEIEEAILSGEVDCGVHSLKDMSSFLPDGLVINHVLPRENPRDAFLSNACININSVPAGGIIATSSPRRQAMLKAYRPDIIIIPMRGNVKTRIEKLRGGDADAIILAVAGLNRLGLEHNIAEEIPVDIMLPSACQGIVGIEIKQCNDDLAQIFDKLNCPNTLLCSFAERGALQALDGSCHTPIGSYAEYNEGTKEIYLRVNVLSLDGKNQYKDEVKAIINNIDDARNLGFQLGQKLKSIVPQEIIAA